MAFKMRGPSLYTDSDGFRKGHNIKDGDSALIKSNKITMTEEDGSPLEEGPLLGTGTTTGITKYMKPGKDYEFAGDNEVVETPLAQKKSKAKWRKDGTLKKVVTKDKETGYRSVIRFDKEGRIKLAKNNRTKNKHKKSKQRLSRASWIKEDMDVYSSDPDIVSTKDYSPPKKKKKVVETPEEKRNRIYNRT
tara:strand:- start:109 stop:681 length:573 start_codon:yes stop_codon:yes gene_type:complete